MEITRDRLAQARDAAIVAYEGAEFYSANILLAVGPGKIDQSIIEAIQVETAQLKRVIKRLKDHLTAPVLRFIEEHSAGSLAEFRWRGGTYATAHQGARKALDVALCTTELELPFVDTFDWPSVDLDIESANRIYLAHKQLNPENYEVAVARVKREWALAVGAAVVDPNDSDTQGSGPGRKAIAIGILAEHQEWSDQEIADAVTEYSGVKTTKGVVNRWLKPIRENYEEQCRRDSPTVIGPDEV